MGPVVSLKYCHRQGEKMLARLTVSIAELGQNVLLRAPTVAVNASRSPQKYVELKGVMAAIRLLRIAVGTIIATYDAFHNRHAFACSSIMK